MALPRTQKDTEREPETESVDNEVLAMPPGIQKLPSLRYYCLLKTTAPLIIRAAPYKGRLVSLVFLSCRDFFLSD